MTAKSKRPICRPACIPESHDVLMHTGAISRARQSMRRKSTCRVVPRGIILSVPFCQKRIDGYGRRVPLRYSSQSEYEIRPRLSVKPLRSGQIVPVS